MKKISPAHTAKSVEASPAPQHGNDLMQALLAKVMEPRPAPIFGVAVARIRSVWPEGCVSVEIPALAIADAHARVTCALEGLTPGTAVAVMFEQGDASRPLVIGPMVLGADDQATRSAETEVLVDRQRVVIEASEELELRCGDATIILTADGRILQRGAYISSDASATQRIRGGSVQIN